MSLKVTRFKTQSIVGTQAILIRDDVKGGMLVIQSEADQILIKLSDLMDVIKAQDAEGSKGEDVNE